jgi:hypothetical protein
MTIDTLVQDIYGVIDGNGLWDMTNSHHLGQDIETTTYRRLGKDNQRDPLARGGLRMSNLGQPCTRKLWYTCNLPASDAEQLRPSTKFKFLYGDLLEDVIINLVIAAGHEVTGLQGEMSIDGIKGHRDCVIDGMTVDVKTASPFAFTKFKKGELRGEGKDAFGYIGQLSSYVYAAKDDPLVTDKKRGAFLAVDKVSGEICLDIYDFTKEIAEKEETVKRIKAEVNASEPPARAFEPVADGKQGNMKLPVNCSYCDFKKHCHPGLRTFLYSGGPRFLTEVVKKPFNKYGPIREAY